MEQKKSFILYGDNGELFKLLQAEDQSKLIMAIFDYVNNGIAPEFTGALGMAFQVLKMQLDRDMAKWEEVQRKKSEGGKKSGETRRKSKILEESSTVLNTLEHNVNVNVNENVTDNVNVTDNDNDIGSVSGSQSYLCDELTDDEGETFTTYFQYKFNCRLSKKQKSDIDRLLRAYGEDTIVSVIDGLDTSEVTKPIPYVRKCLERFGG